MKKMIPALVALGLCSSAGAQSSVEMFGTADAALAYLHSSGGSVLGLSTGGNNISRIGFRGTEDLGDGLKAGFWMEAGWDVDTGNGKSSSGSLIFNRRSTVSLMGRLGEIRLGRDDSATFLNTLMFDPFLTNGVGGTMMFYMLPGAPTIQISNAVSYFTPSLNGFFGQAQYVAGEQDGATVPGSYRGMRLGYRDQRLFTVAAYGKLYGTSTTVDERFGNFGAWYDFGFIKPMLLVATAASPTVRVNAVQLGMMAPLGQGVLRASIGHYNTTSSNADWNKFAIGYGYDLSIRTQLYSSVGLVKNGTGAKGAIIVQGFTAPTAGLDTHSTGIEVGIRHFF